MFASFKKRLVVFEGVSAREGKIRGIIRRISLVRDAELGKVYPDRWPAVVEIRTRAGQTHAARVDFPKGDPKNPMS